MSDGQPTATVLIAYPPYHGDTLVQRLTTLGASVRYRADTLGYLRVDLPTGHVLEAADLPGIDAINLNGTQSYGASVEPPGLPRKAEPDGAVAPAPAATSELPPRPAGQRTLGPVLAHHADSVRWRVVPPDATTPKENPYLPMRDVGAPQFVAAHPTFDGRGVTIGAVECCPDFRHPVFQEPALTLDGRPTRKLAALYTVVANDSEAANRIHARDAVTIAHHRFAYDGVTYRASRNGAFRIGYYFGPTRFHEFARWRVDTFDVPTHRRAALLDPHSGEVWLDLLGDHDFGRGPPLRDYNATGDVAAFDRDDPATPWDDRLSFAVRVDTAQATIDVYPGNGGHITGVAGIAVGAHLYGGAATGAAPHARMVFVSEGGGWKGEGSHQSSRIEAMILLAQRPDVDIITSQEAYGLRLKDGHSVWSIIADRIVTTYHKLIFQAAGNEGGGLGTVFEATNGQYVMKVGGSINRDTWYTAFALLADRQDYLFRYASRGPDANGGTSPDFVTPMVHLMPSPMGLSRDPAIRMNVGYFSSQAIYRNPPGYTLQFGTSYATPTASGVAALLLSAARQTGTSVDPARMHWALSESARYLAGYQAYEQGAGILAATAAWERLQRAPVPVDIAVEAPIRTVMSPYLHTPGSGRGLYEREGWTAGDTGTRLMTFTRTSGPSTVLPYHLKWLGNDGTFTSEPAITLGLNTPVTTAVMVNPQTSGAHSALLQLIGEDGRTPAQQMSAVVVAAQPLDAAHHYTFTDHGHAEWLRKTSYFVSVPPGAAALDLALAIEHGTVALSIVDPSGGVYPSTTPFVRGRHYDWPADIAIGKTQHQSHGVIRRTIEYPEPGVWEIVVEHEGSATPEVRLKPQTPATFTFTAAVTRMTAGPAGLESASAMQSRPLPLTIAVHNDFAGVTARIVGGPLASVAREQFTFRPGAPAIMRTLSVDSGTTRLGIKIGHVSDAAADIDVHVFDCTGSHCDPYVAAVFQGAEKELRVQHPRPGQWRIVIDPYDLPSGVVTLEYQDELVHPKYGTASVSNPLLRLTSGGADTVSVVVHPGVVPEAGRSRELRLEAESTEEQTPSGPPSRGGVRYPNGVLGVIRVDLESMARSSSPAPSSTRSPRTSR